MLLVNQGLAALRLAMQPDGFNIGVNLGKAAGAGIEAHVHIHVVPRWNGDTSFMSAVGEHAHDPGDAGTDLPAACKRRWPGYASDSCCRLQVETAGYNRRFSTELTDRFCYN